LRDRTLQEDDAERMEQVAFDKNGSQLNALERAIDEIDAQLPKLTKFILPSGGLASCSFHVARSTCRRAERALVSLRAREAVQANALHFLNR
jgi:cob(I)alamin adenosyltransferase